RASMVLFDELSTLRPSASRISLPSTLASRLTPISLIATEAPTATLIALPMALPAIANANPPASAVIDDESSALMLTAPVALIFEPLRILAWVSPRILLYDSDPARLPAKAVPVPEPLPPAATPSVRA